VIGSLLLITPPKRKALTVRLESLVSPNDSQRHLNTV